MYARDTRRAHRRSCGRSDHYWVRATSTVFANGLPCLSVSAGFAREVLHVGLQVATAHGNDRPLLRVAEVFAQATRFADLRPQLFAVPQG